MGTCLDALCLETGYEECPQACLPQVLLPFHRLGGLGRPLQLELTVGDQRALQGQVGEEEWGEGLAVQVQQGW